MRVPTSAVIGEVRNGFRYVLDGWNAERILVALEAGDNGCGLNQRTTERAISREVVGHKIGSNQGVQILIADAFMKIQAADRMRFKAARVFDAGQPRAEANIAKHLASEASWETANAALDTHGGYGFVDKYDIERTFGDSHKSRVAPFTINMIKSFTGTKVLGLPRPN